MFINTNPYTLRTEIIDGITCYYVSFEDGGGTSRETEVSRPVYLEFLRFIKVERNLRRWDERHMEQSELNDEMLYSRAVFQQRSVEDAISDSLLNEQLQMAVISLSKLQRRRFILYHEFGLTYEQIAQIEGCTSMPVKRSICRAEKKIREIMKFFQK